MFTTGDLDSNILLPGFFVDNVKAPTPSWKFCPNKTQKSVLSELPSLSSSSVVWNCPCRFVTRISLQTSGSDTWTQGQQQLGEDQLGTPRVSYGNRGMV